jgi:hypothetical protein
MKNCICCLSILILANLVACSDAKEREQTKEEGLEPLNTSVRLIHKVETNSINMDSILDVEVAEKEKIQAAQLETALETIVALKKSYDESTEEEENYVEAIPFTTFLGNPVESGALEIIQFGDHYTRIYADYFDGSPIGGKLFFVHNNALVAIEIIQLKEKVTENGAFIQDESTHILYYHDEALLSTIDLSTNKAVEPSSITWLDENLVDWTLVKAHINTL